MYVNKCSKCGLEFETKNPKRVICPACLYPDRNPILKDIKEDIPQDTPQDSQPQQERPSGQFDNPRRPDEFPRREGFQGRDNYHQPGEGGYGRPQGGFQGRDGGYSRPQQGGYDRPQGGYQQREGGYGRPQGGPRSGGYDRPQGGYQQREGGYSRPQQGGYDRPQGGYDRGPRPGGYDRPQGGYQQREGGYSRPQGGYDRPQGGPRPGGFNRPQGSGFGRPQGGPPRSGGFGRPQGGPRPGGFGRPQGGGFGRRPQVSKQLLISREQVAQIEVLYKRLLPLPNPDAHEVIGKEIELEPNKVFFGINLVRQKLFLPKLPYPKRKLALTPDQLIAIKNLYEPLLPLPPIGCHKFIAKQLKIDEWRVHVGIGILRKQMNLPRWNPERDDVPEEFKGQKQIPVEEAPKEEAKSKVKEAKKEAPIEEIKEEEIKAEEPKSKKKEKPAEKAADEEVDIEE